MATASRKRTRNRRRSAGGASPGIMDDILAMAGSLASTRKEYAAEQIETLAGSVRDFAETMPPIPTVRAYAATAAESLEELADYVGESDLTDMVQDARDLMRRHPLATLGGSIAAGLIITQLFQARGVVFDYAAAGNNDDDNDDDRSSGRRARRGRRSEDDTGIVDPEAAGSDESAGPMF